MPEQFVGVLTCGGHNRGVIEPHPLSGEVFAGLRDALLRERASMVMLCEESSQLIDDLADDRLACVVAYGQLFEPTIEILSQLNRPVIHVEGNTWSKERCIRRDENRTGRMVARVALAGASDRLLYFDVSPVDLSHCHYSHPARLEGVRSVADREQVPLEVVDLASTADCEIIRTILETHQPSTAIICSDYYVEQWLTCLVLAARGKHLLDLPLFSCDDARRPLSHALKMTRAHFDRYGMGVLVGEMAVRLMRDPAASCPSLLLEPTLVPHNLRHVPPGDSLPLHHPLRPPAMVAGVPTDPHTIVYPSAA